MINVFFKKKNGLPATHYNFNREQIWIPFSLLLLIRLIVSICILIKHINNHFYHLWPLPSVAVTFTTPSFGGDSYLAYPEMDAFMEVEIVIEFQPGATEGVLLYEAQTAEGNGDFISLAIVNNQVEFRWVFQELKIMSYVIYVKFWIHSVFSVMLSMKAYFS